MISTVASPYYVGRRPVKATPGGYDVPGGDTQVTSIIAPIDERVVNTPLAMNRLFNQRRAWDVPHVLPVSTKEIEHFYQWRLGTRLQDMVPQVSMVGWREEAML